MIKFSRFLGNPIGHAMRGQRLPAFLLFQVRDLFAFVKERFHNAVEIDILGIFEEYSSLQIWPPQKIFQGRNYSGRMT